MAHATRRSGDEVDRIVRLAEEWKAISDPADRRLLLEEAVWAQEIESGVRVMPDGTNKHNARGIASALRWTAGDTEDTPA
jgi:hypothetical protein